MKITFNKQNPNGVRRSHIVVKHIVTRTVIHSFICKALARSRVIYPAELRTRETLDEYVRYTLKWHGESAADSWEDDIICRGAEQQEEVAAKIEAEANAVIDKFYPELAKKG